MGIKKSHISCALGAFAFGLTVNAGPVFAQQEETGLIDASAQDEQIETVDPQASNPAREANNVRDEVIVTANLREQDIQDVPLSIQAIGEEELRDRGIDSLNEMTFFIPAFSVGVADGGIGGSISMRGITSSNNRGMDTGVSIVIDDVYYGRIEYAVDNFLDMNRAEILRGPQGTLFGKNSVTGAISLHTNDPDFDGWSLDIDGAMFAEYDGGFYSAVVNAPIFDEVLGLRAAWRTHYAVLNDYRNTYEPDEDTFQRKSVGRLKLRLDPAQGLSVVLSAGWLKSITQGAFTQISKGTDEWTFFNRQFDPEYETNDDDKQTSLDQTPYLTKDTLTFTGQAKYDFSSDWRVTYTGGYSTFDQSTDGEIDFMPAPVLTVQLADTFSQTSHEVRLISPESLFGNRLNFAAGLFYFWAHYDGHSRIGALETESLGTTAQALIGTPAVSELLNQLGLASVLDIPFAQDGSPLLFDQITNSYAAYAQGDVTIIEDLILTLGLRYTYETKEIHIARSFDQTGAAFRALVGYEEFDEMRDRSESSVIPRVSLRYRMTDDIMFFTTWGKGFKSGGYNANAGSASEVEYEEETSVTYEAGVKSEFFSGITRFNATIYQTELDNFQFSMFNGLEFVVTNAPSVRARGIEVDAFTALPYNFFVMGAFAYSDTIFTSFPDAPCAAGDDGPCDLSGQQTASSPKYTASFGFGYMHEFANLPFNLIIGVDGSYKSEQFLDFDLDPETKQEAYTLYNALLELRSEDENWRINLRVENIFDKFHRTSQFDAPLATGNYVSIPGGYRGVTFAARVSF